MTTAKTAVSVTYHEITTQTTAWQEAIQVVAQNADNLQKIWQEGNYNQLLFTGCGSTHYLSLAAAALFQELVGIPARGVPAGELVLYPKINYAKTSRTLLVAISRSAETTETVQAVKQFKQAKRGSVIVISNNAQRPLSILGDLNLIMPDGQEKGIAQTRSFASMYIAAVALTAVLANRSDLLEKMEQLPAIGQRLLTQYEDLAHTWGANLELERIYFLGSGERYGLACEANLKMKEMTLTDSEPFHFLEFRHGPISMVGANALVIGLVSEKNRALETAVLYDAARLGSQTLWLGEQQCDINFNAALPETIQNVLYLPILQLIAYYRAIAKNLNPDQPHNLDMVVKLDWLQTEPPPAVAGLKTEPP